MDKHYSKKPKKHDGFIMSKKNRIKMIKGYKEMARISIEICECDSEIALQTLENYEEYLSECDK